MSMPMFRACVAGYEDRLFDMQLVAVHGGHWAGYFGMSKRPKPLGTILDKLYAEKKKSERRDKKRQVKVKKRVLDVDVEKFKQQERRFQERLNATNNH